MLSKSKAFALASVGAGHESEEIMNNLSRNYVNDEGEEETLVASSSDNYQVKLGDKYTLSNHEVKKEGKLAKKFKNSILGADIGAKSSGFSSVVGLAVVIALAVLAVLYFIFRF